MRYVPDLIPDDKKVLPNYFKGSPYTYPEKNRVLTVLGYIGAVFFILSAFAFIEQPIVTTLFGVVGFLLLPIGHNAIEKIFRFRFTSIPKTVVCVLLILLSFPFIDKKEKHDKIVENEKIVQAQREREAKVLSEQRENARLDSFKIRYVRIQELEKNNKYNEAIVVIDTELGKVHLPNEVASLEQDKTSVVRAKAISLFKLEKYKEALPLISDLLSQNGSDPELVYDRGVCYYKTGKIAEAVSDLKRSMEFGNEDAKKLHERINPIRKRVIGYTTQCCDGTFSSARGRVAHVHGMEEYATGIILFMKNTENTSSYERQNFPNHSVKEKKVFFSQYLSKTLMKMRLLC